ncbi:hypothetical protein SFUMM280S_03425 [Streptomyces fumanus]
MQHTHVPYTGTYGQVLMDGLGRLFTLLAGSAWEVTDPARRNVLDSVERAFAPFLHDGLVMDCVNGRAISRGLSTDDQEDPARRPLPRNSSSSPRWRSWRAGRTRRSATAGTR